MPSCWRRCSSPARTASARSRCRSGRWKCCARRSGAWSARSIEMIRNGQENVAIADRLHRWTRALMLTADAADLPDVLVRELKHQFLIPQAASASGAAPRRSPRCRSPAASSDDVQELRRQPGRAVLRRQLRLRGGAVAGRAGAGDVDGAGPAAPREPRPAPSACWCWARPTRRATPPTWAPSSWCASARSPAPALSRLLPPVPDELARRPREQPTRRDADVAAPTCSTCAVERRLAARTLALYRDALRAAAALRRAAAVPLREAQTHHVRRWAAQLHGAAWRRAASRSCCRPGAASTAGWGAGPGRRQPGRRRARAERRQAAAEGAVGRPRGGAGRARDAERHPALRRARPLHRRAAVRLRPARRRTGRARRRAPARERRRLDRRRRRQRARARQGQQAAQRAGRARRRCRRSQRGCAARALARAGRAGAVRQPPRHAADARARCARA